MAWYEDVFRFVMNGRKPDGSLDECQLDHDRNLRVVVAASGEATSWDDPPDALAERVVLERPGALWSLVGMSDTYGYLIVFDSPVVPDDGARGVFVIQTWPGYPIDLPLPRDRGRKFERGIAWAASSTFPALTKIKEARLWVNAERSLSAKPTT